MIFVSKVARATELDRLLTECNFPSVCIHSGMGQEERISRYKDFKDFKKRILVSTDLFGRGIDIERVNIVVNYDFPEVKEGNAPTVASDQYLHRVGRAGRFGTKGLAISFISSKEDADILAQVQSRFEVDVSELPDQIDISSYMSLTLDATTRLPPALRRPFHSMSSRLRRTSVFGRGTVRGLVREAARGGARGDGVS